MGSGDEIDGAFDSTIGDDAHQFSGTFDGNGHVISNLSCALFGANTGNATVTGCYFYNCSVDEPIVGGTFDDNTQLFEITPPTGMTVTAGDDASIDIDGTTYYKKGAAISLDGTATGGSLEIKGLGSGDTITYDENSKTFTAGSSGITIGGWELSTKNYTWSAITNGEADCSSHFTEGGVIDGGSITYRASTENNPTKLFKLVGIASTEGIEISVGSVEGTESQSVVTLTKDNLVKPAEFSKLGTTVVRLESYVEDEGNGYAFDFSDSADELARHEIPTEGEPIALSEDKNEITTSGVYSIPKDFTGTLTIDGESLNVKLIGEDDAVLQNVVIDAREAAGIKLTVQNVNITSTGTDPLIRLGSGNNILTVKESNSFGKTGTSTKDKAVIHCSGNLTILGDGELKASSTNAKSSSAIIGSNKGQELNGSNITIGGSVKVDITNDGSGSCIGVGGGTATIGEITVAGTAQITAKNSDGEPISNPIDGSSSGASIGNVTIGLNASVNGENGTATVKDTEAEPAAPVNSVKVDWELVTESGVTKAKCSKLFYTEGYGTDGPDGYEVRYYARDYDLWLTVNNVTEKPSGNPSTAEGITLNGDINEITIDINRTLTLESPCDLRFIVDGDLYTPKDISQGKQDLILTYNASLSSQVITLPKDELQTFRVIGGNVYKDCKMTAKNGSARLMAEEDGTLTLTQGTVEIADVQENPPSESQFVVINGGTLEVENYKYSYSSGSSSDDGMKITLVGRTISGLSKGEGIKEENLDTGQQTSYTMTAVGLTTVINNVNVLADGTNPDGQIAMGSMNWKMLIAPSGGTLDLSGAYENNYIIVDSITAPSERYADLDIEETSISLSKPRSLTAISKIKLDSKIKTASVMIPTSIEFEATKDETYTVNNTAFVAADGGTLTFQTTDSEGTATPRLHNGSVTVDDKIVFGDGTYLNVKTGSISVTAADGTVTAFGALDIGDEFTMNGSFPVYKMTSIGYRRLYHPRQHRKSDGETRRR